MLRPNLKFKHFFVKFKKKNIFIWTKIVCQYNVVLYIFFSKIAVTSLSNDIFIEKPSKISFALQIW